MPVDPNSLVRGETIRLTQKPELHYTGEEPDMYEGKFLGTRTYSDGTDNIEIQMSHRRQGLWFRLSRFDITRIPVTTEQDRLNKKIVMGELLGSPGGQDYEEAKTRWTKTAGRRRNKKRKTRRRK